MKIYLIDNTKKIKKVKKELEETFIVETKENCKFKMTKNDFVVLSDETGTLEELDKLKNIIFITTNKDYKYIWKLANQCKTIDIIDNSAEDNYIVKRIKKIVGREA